VLNIRSIFIVDFDHAAGHVPPGCYLQNGRIYCPPP
jgi:hypothetical protein